MGSEHHPPLLRRHPVGRAAVARLGSLPAPVHLSPAVPAMRPQQYAKALLAALIAGLSALVPGLDDGLTDAEAITSVVAALVALGAVFAVPNQAAAGHTADPDLSEQSGVADAGQVDVLTVCLVVLFSLVVLLLFGALPRA